MMNVLTHQISDEQIKQAVDLLRQGKLLGLPTETVYGLAADASQAAAVQKIFSAKGRPADHPLIVHLASAHQIDAWAQNIPSAAYALAKAFWPGPMTLILPKAGHVLDLVTGGQDTVGLRVPSHPVAQAVLAAFGGGLATPSANRFGRISPTTAEHVRQELGESVALVLEGGASQVGIESTIVSLAHPDEQAVILRPGAISPSQLETVLGYRPQVRSRLSAEASGAPTDLPRVSGDLLSHYAPRTPLCLCPASQLSQELLQRQSRGQTCAVIAQSAQNTSSPNIRLWLNLPPDPAGYAQALYAALRQADEIQAHSILLTSPPATEAWQAVYERLNRAAAKTT